MSDVRRADGGYPAKFYWAIPDQVDGAWEARRELSAALRDLAHRCVTSTVDAETLAAAAGAVRDLAETLPPGPTSADAFRDRSYFDEPRIWVDRGALMGRCNPVAPPMFPVFADGRSVCELVLPEVYVGAPGMVHGGYLAACFDQICGHCVVMSERSGFTARLDIRYHKPTPVNVPVRFEATLLSATESRLTLHATCSRAEVLLCEAHGLFIELDPAKAEQLIAGAGDR